MSQLEPPGDRGDRRDASDVPNPPQEPPPGPPRATSTPPPPGPPPPTGPPPPPGPAPATHQPPPPAYPVSRRTRKSTWIWVGVGLLLLLTGCGVFAVAAVSGFVGRMTAPVDVANEYLEAARTTADVAPYACEDAPPVDPEVADSRTQYLGDVTLSGRRFATVSGTITLGDGFETEITMRLSNDDDAWCVREVRF